MTSGEGPAFATVEQVAAEFRPLSDVEKVSAERLLDEAARWIRQEYRKYFDTDIAIDHPGAISVSIDVVKAALRTDVYAGHTSYSRSRTEGPRAKADSGTLSAPGGALAFTDWHKAQLGIPTRPQPKFNFPRGDY